MDRHIVTTAALHVSYVCTHRCPMCYANSSKSDESNAKHPPVNMVKNVISELVKNGVNNISFVGGDPAIYPFILDVSEYAHSLGCTLSILSNTLSFGKAMSNIVKYIDCFEGTIHDCNARRHDEFCQREGAYDLLVSNLKYFSDLDQKIGITINITPFTYDKIYDIVNAIILKGINLHHLVFQRIIPFGRAEKNHSYELTLQQLETALNQVELAEKSFDLQVIFEDPFPLCAIKPKFYRYMHPCEWGITKVSVDYKGNLSRCGADPRCSLGNIFEIGSLSNLWENSNELLEFRKKDYLETKCHNCNMLERCGGACPISQHPELGFTQDYISNL